MRNIAAAAPVDTGRLRQSFKYRLSANDTIALLYGLEDASYWRYLEYGTVYIPAGPFVAPQLLHGDQLIRDAVRDAFNDFIHSEFNFGGRIG